MVAHALAREGDVVVQHTMMPLGVFFQKKLTLNTGLIDTRKVDEVLLVCRKQGTEGRVVLD